MFSERTRFSREPNQFAAAHAEAVREGRALLDLTRSNPTILGFPYAKQEITAALSDERALEYEPAAFGLSRAREALKLDLERDGISIPLERILLTASTSEAYSFAFKLLCDPGDRVLVPRPSYPLLEHLAALEHVTLESYWLEYDGAWHVDFESLRSAIVPNTKAIVVVSPNNPTGSYLSSDELQRLASFGLPIISDEVFARFPFLEDPRRARSVLEAEGVLSLCLGGLSKLAGLPQLKLGWMLVGGPEQLAQEALARLEIIADAFLSVGAPVQHALPTLLEHAAATREAIRNRLKQNLARLTLELAGSSAHVLRVEGGWYAVVRMPSTRTDEEWALHLLDQGVVVQPGWLFDFRRGSELVLSLLGHPEELAEGARRIALVTQEPM
jgi:aspartate/methionine/tyrosine aminotransferase